MTARIDLKELAVRESEQIEWKENVADVDDVVEALSAFANDLSNLGGGYVVCGAREEKDEHGFPRLKAAGLTAARLKEIEGRVMTRCRERVAPEIVPVVEELAADSEERRILVFIMAATPNAHIFRRGDGPGRYYVRLSRETREARNGVLRELLVRKGASEPWDRRMCAGATVNDVDLLALRDTLQRIGQFSPERGVEPFLSESATLSPFVPPLFAREPLNGQLRPRNFAMLLFGRNTQRFIPGAYSIFSSYPGQDRSELHAERHDIPGTLVDQARRLIELLDVQSFVAFDKTDPRTPNALKYPKRALHEAMVNALAHRDYELADPTRITVFADRIEVLSPGSLPIGVDPLAFSQGKAAPRWRNQALAWFFSRLQLAQAEGQGIPTILRTMKEEGNPAPVFDANEGRVICVLPAHPRHALAREHRAVEQALSLGDPTRAQVLLRPLLEQDPFNFRTVQLFAEVQRAVRDVTPLADFVSQHEAQLDRLPGAVLIHIVEALLVADAGVSERNRQLAAKVLQSARRARVEEQDARRIIVSMVRTRDERGALDYMDRQVQEHPEWSRSAAILQLKGNALIGLAKRCSHTGRNQKLPRETRRRAWEDCRRYLDQAERSLREAQTLGPDATTQEHIELNLKFLEDLRRKTTPRRAGPERDG